MLRGCLECGETKGVRWFDLDETLCNTCSRQTDKWLNDTTVYPPVIQSVVPNIDWSVIECPNPYCRCRLFMEEVLQFRRATNTLDKFPCCANGSADLEITWRSGEHPNQSPAQR